MLPMTPAGRKASKYGAASAAAGAKCAAIDATLPLLALETRLSVSFPFLVVLSAAVATQAIPNPGTEAS